MYVETSSLYSNIGVAESFEYAAKAALGLFNKPLITSSTTPSCNNNKKQKKLNTLNKCESTSCVPPIKNKSNYKSELKGKAKNCSIM